MKVVKERREIYYISFILFPLLLAFLIISRAVNEGSTRYFIIGKGVRDGEIN